MFAVVPSDSKNPNGSTYDVNVYDKKVTFKLKKGFAAGYHANQYGLIGMLINKILSKFVSDENFEVSLDGITKIEHYSGTDPMGRQLNNIMFWNTDAASADYKNIYFSLSVPDGEVSAVKDVVKKLISGVKIEETKKEA
jgi:hypothetical protein